MELERRRMAGRPARTLPHFSVVAKLEGQAIVPAEWASLKTGDLIMAAHLSCTHPAVCKRLQEECRRGRGRPSLYMMESSCHAPTFTLLFSPLHFDAQNFFYRD